MGRTLVVGTGNPAKKQAIQAALAPLDITVQGTDDLGLALEIEEDGRTVQENARKKSLAYARAVGRAVLSMDNALYLDGLPDAEQPGIHTRRLPGHNGRATDAEMLHYYAGKIRALGGSVRGHWIYGVCIATAHGQTHETTITAPRLFVSEPCAAMIPGYPLESIQIEPESGRYIAEMTETEQAAFWQRTIGGALCEFVRTALPR